MTYIYWHVCLSTLNSSLKFDCGSFFFFFFFRWCSSEPVWQRWALSGRCVCLRWVGRSATGREPESRSETELGARPLPQDDGFPRAGRQMVFRSLSRSALPQLHMHSATRPFKRSLNQTFQPLLFPMTLKGLNTWSGSIVLIEQRVE